MRNNIRIPKHILKAWLEDPENTTKVYTPKGNYYEFKNRPDDIVEITLFHKWVEKDPISSCSFCYGEGTYEHPHNRSELKCSCTSTTISEDWE